MGPVAGSLVRVPRCHEAGGQAPVGRGRRRRDSLCPRANPQSEFRNPKCLPVPSSISGGPSVSQSPRDAVAGCGTDLDGQAGDQHLCYTQDANSSTTALVNSSGTRPPSPGGYGGPMAQLPSRPPSPAGYGGPMASSPAFASRLRRAHGSVTRLRLAATAGLWLRHPPSPRLRRADGSVTQPPAFAKATAGRWLSYPAARLRLAATASRAACPPPAGHFSTLYFIWPLTNAMQIRTQN